MGRGKACGSHGLATSGAVSSRRSLVPNTIQNSTTKKTRRRSADGCRLGTACDARCAAAEAAVAGLKRRSREEEKEQREEAGVEEAAKSRTRNTSNTYATRSLQGRRSGWSLLAHRRDLPAA
ncbi:unnamed protein product [Prorocentrum cordatum]|uniref:Uncharacterized protein n=1 Tax=Prorocentrum cordatum TaxID=2364126 RepID=A0ABN9YBA5_9DINO|nr:unnamed protein product [Polarella glacialis]